MTVRTLNYVKSAFAVASLAVLFYFVPLTDTVDALMRADPVWFLTGLVGQFAARAVGTVRMQVVAANQGIALSLLQLYRILLSAQFYSVLLPGPLAGGGAAWLKYIQHGAAANAAAAVVVINRAIGLGTMVALGACAWAFDRSSDLPLLGMGIVVSVLCAAAILVLLPPQRHPNAPLRAAGNGFRRRTGQLVRRLMLFRRISRSGKLIILTSALIQELLGALVMLSFAKAVGAEVGFLSVLWIRAALIVLLLLPVTVAGLGLREVSLVGLGAVVGVAAVPAMAWSFAILAGTIVVAAFGGLIEARSATSSIERYQKKRRNARRRWS